MFADKSLDGRKQMEEHESDEPADNKDGEKKTARRQKKFTCQAKWTKVKS